MTWRISRSPAWAAFFKKPGTNCQGSQLFPENMQRTSKEAGLFRKTRHEFAGKLNFSRTHQANVLSLDLSVFQPTLLREKINPG
jgi:hypothetical protein